MIRKLSNCEKSVFLTFDDGPCGESTSRVLDVLHKQSVPATFFLIGKKVRSELPLVKRMVAEGHSLGNHSWDHGYGNYFTSTDRLKTWITNVAREFAVLNLPEPIGFRPPAGVVTPQVLSTLRQLEEPLVMWNERFFDSVFAWGCSRAERAARTIKGGSIVLLHDAQKPSRVEGFCNSLDKFIDSVRARGLDFDALTRESCSVEMPRKRHPF